MEPTKNRFCRSIGHDWKDCISTTFRVCAREQCHAAEQMVNGTWVPVPPSDKRRGRETGNLARPLSTLWNLTQSTPNTLVTLTPFTREEIYPDHSRADEQRAEHTYQCLISGKRVG